MSTPAPQMRARCRSTHRQVLLLLLGGKQALRRDGDVAGGARRLLPASSGVALEACHETLRLDQGRNRRQFPVRAPQSYLVYLRLADLQKVSNLHAAQSV